MGARTGSSPMVLMLAAGCVQRVLVEAGSSIVLTQGVVTVSFPYAWMAERVVAREALVRAEEIHCLEEGGWIDLLAASDAEAVILSPDQGLWERMGRCVARMLSAAQTERRPSRGAGQATLS